MKAPEKIYLVKNYDTDRPLDYWYNATTDSSKVEYTRTDVFIKEGIITWAQEELDIIERIIYDVQMRKEYYEDNNAPTCVKECEQELKFLEQLKSIKIYDSKR